MKLPKNILHGYDRVTEKYVAQALGIPLKKKKKVHHRKFQLKHVRRRHQA